MTAKSSLVDEAPTKVAGRRDTSFHALRVGAIERLTDDAVAVTFDVGEEMADTYRFRAGQHVTLRFELDGHEHRRSYSICASAVTGTLRIAVKKLDGGVVSSHITDVLRAGDIVDVMPPLGHFGGEPRADRCAEYVAVCAGSGITPVLSIIATTLETEPASHFTLLYGNRTSASVMFLEELADLKNLYLGRLQVFHMLSREAQGTDLLAGHIDSTKLERIFGPNLAESADAWFLCGPMDLVETISTRLMQAGVPERAVHTEIFHVDGLPALERFHVDSAVTDSVATVTATLGGRSSTFEHRSGAGSLLDSMLGARPDAPFSCKGGVCGTCRARLVDGTVAMARHYALEPEEIDAGFVLACQAQPTSEHVTLDFDQ
jgi:ring-1,2-phenylacetyl-CoA epoxidase subunit PaaE